jgi:hypothetical protein
MVYKYTCDGCGATIESRSPIASGWFSFQLVNKWSLKVSLEKHVCSRPECAQKVAAAALNEAL